MKKLLMVVLIWTCQEFFTKGGVIKFLNSLPPERAIEAKVVGLDTTYPIFVFYRVEQ